MTNGIAIQLAIDTLAAAGLYALVALAVSLAYSGSGILHLAIGQVALAGGLVAASLFGDGVPVGLAALAGLVTGGVLSGAAERALVEPVIGSPMVGAVLLVAAAVVTQGVLTGVFPRPAYAFPSASRVYSLHGGLVHEYDLVVVGTVAVVAVAGFLVVRSGRVGTALRLTARAPRMAERLGLDTGRVRVASFAAGGVLATGAVLLGVASFPLAAAGVVALPFRGVAAAAAGRMVSPAAIVGAAVLIAAAEVVGGYELGGGGEFLCDAVAALLVGLAWRR